MTLLHDVNLRFASSYANGLTNHAPMCITALARLGADDARIAEFVTSYAARTALEPAVDDDPRIDALRTELRHDGRDAVLRRRLRTLLAGVAGAAFHGVIRVAYAVMARDDDETARALSYFEANAQPIAVATPSSGKRELGDVVDALRAARIAKPSGTSIRERVDEVVADARFTSVASTLGAVSLEDVSGFAARTYLAADDFASLHMLTGAHAVRVLRPWIDDVRAADRALAIACLACFVVCGSPDRAEARGLQVVDDRELKSRAVASNHDHVAKLVVACLDEEKACADRIYRIVATRAVRRDRA